VGKVQRRVVLCAYGITVAGQRELMSWCEQNWRGLCEQNWNAEGAAAVFLEGLGC
jgi:hypothetical protein